MLMVIFGAGASFDSAPSYPPESPESRRHGDVDKYRLPLADGLFENRPLFATAVSKLPRCRPINSRLRFRPQDTSVEQELQKLQAEAGGDPERHRQLAAVRFYLQYIIFECERHWNDVTKDGTNYDALLDQIRHWRKGGERICLVTFNYDTMLEAALSTVGIKIETLSDYIASVDYKIIKLHGSVNWARKVDNFVQADAGQDKWYIANQLIDQAATIAISHRYLLHNECPTAKWDGNFLFPAVAIPVETKSDYECPPEHLQSLEACIPEVTKLLVIGWRAREYHFLQLLAQNNRPPLRVMIVSGSSESAREVGDRLIKAGVKGDFSLATGGFTNFVLSDEATEFLQR